MDWFQLPAGKRRTTISHQSTALDFVGRGTESTNRRLIWNIEGANAFHHWLPQIRHTKNKNKINAKNYSIRILISNHRISTLPKLYQSNRNEIAYRHVYYVKSHVHNCSLYR